jgi:hypothetical protein
MEEHFEVCKPTSLISYGWFCGEKVALCATVTQNFESIDELIRDGKRPAFKSLEDWYGNDGLSFIRGKIPPLEFEERDQSATRATLSSLHKLSCEELQDIVNAQRKIQTHPTFCITGGILPAYRHYSMRNFPTNVELGPFEYPDGHRDDLWIETKYLVEDYD